MPDFPLVQQMLRTFFDVNGGLSDDVAIGLYQRALPEDMYESLKSELRIIFADPHTSWKAMLCNIDYEVLDANSEDEARAHAKKILWDPIFLPAD